MSKGRPKRGRSGSERARRASPTSSSSSTRPGAENPVSSSRAARGTVGEGKTPVDSTAEAVDGFIPLTVEEARALMTEAGIGVDRSALLAERAEAEAQLRAAQATLGIPPAPAANGRAAAEQQPDAVDSGGQSSTPGDDRPDGHRRPFDVDGLRRAAHAARAADDKLAGAAAGAAARPLSGETLPTPGAHELGTAESAFARALDVREDLPPAWRRLAGALISATGMAIVIGALGWNVYWLLVPIALIAIMTVDLRVAGQAAREASVEAARELASVGVAGVDGLDRIRLERTKIEEAEARLAAARAARDAAYARFEDLAPGRLPSEVELIIAEYEAELSDTAGPADPTDVPDPAQTAGSPDKAAPPFKAKLGDIVKRAEGAPPATSPDADVATAAISDPAPRRPLAQSRPSGSVVPSGERPYQASAPPDRDVPPAPVPPPVRALAERLSAEGRQALARIEAQLAALDRVELAKRSLEWHQAQPSADPPGEDQPPA